MATKAIITQDTSRALRAMGRALDADPRVKSPETRRGYWRDLRAFETWRAGRPLGKLLVEQYAAELQSDGKSPNTINRALASVRWWARKMADAALDDRTLTRHEREEAAARAARVAVVEDVKGKRLAKGREVSPGELAALMRVCVADESPAGVRDAAIIGLAWATGARRSELAGLLLADVRWSADDEADVMIRKGKGDKPRAAYVYNGAAVALRDWLSIRGDGAGPLFYAVNKGGKVQVGHGLSDEALALMLAKRAEQAGLSEPVTWHDFRRTFAGSLLDAGHDLVTVQKLMGHESPTTTSNYDRRGDESKRRAVRSLHVPYRRRK